MSDVNQLLTKRLKKNEQSSKMAEMSKQSAKGNLNTFSGLFSVTELNEGEKNYLEAILHEFNNGKNDISVDLRSLISITSEVKAINNQAAILHGERIKKAQEILKQYKDGAFSTWLVGAYGNRQTPYNFLQYYEFYSAMPKILRPQIEIMPRQAIYTLASREGPLEQKREIVEKYNGQTKAELLTLIREKFPLAASDQRKENIGESTIRSLIRHLSRVRSRNAAITKSQKTEIFALLDELYECVEQCKTR